MTKNPNKAYLWLLTLVFVGVILVRNAWVGDDAFISFRVADNFLNGYGLRWNIIERVQAYTHPLWLMVMIGVSFFTGEYYYTAIVLSILFSLTSMWVLFAYINKKSWSGFAAVAMLICSKAFVDYTTSGLENALSYLLVGLFLAAYFAHSVKPLRVALLFALVILNRMDLFLLVLPPLLDVMWRTRGKRRDLLMMFAGFTPFVAWEVFSLIYYGFPFPNTAYAKLFTGIPRVELIHQGFFYLIDSIATDPITLVGIVLASVSGLMSGEHRHKVLSASLIAVLFYIVWIGGDFMSGRFLAVPYFFAACVLARQWVFWRPTVALGLLTTVFVFALFVPRNPILSDAEYKGDFKGDFFHHNGIVDERGFYYAEMGLLNARRNVRKGDVNHSWYGIGLAESAQKVVDEGAVGFIGYGAGPKTFIIDFYGLGDALLARLPALYEPVWRVGHFSRRIPRGYIETIKTRLDHFEDKKLGAFYHYLKVVTQDRIFSWRRFKTIIAMNLGKHNALIDREKYKFDPTVVNEDKLNIPKPPGTPWDEPGNILFGNAVDVRLMGVSKAHNMEISLDHNDVYAVRFCLVKACTEQIVELQQLLGGGLSVAKVKISDAASAQGFDHVFIYPVEGDGSYSLGHLILDE